MSFNQLSGHVLWRAYAFSALTMPMSMSQVTISEDWSKINEGFYMARKNDSTKRVVILTVVLIIGVYCIKFNNRTMRSMTSMTCIPALSYLTKLKIIIIV